MPGYDEPLFPVADTEIGRIGCAICYDWLFPEALRQLAMNGAEVLLRVSAYMDPWGATEPMDWWTLVNRCRALENMAYVVAANQGAQLRRYPPYSWPGGSMLVDFDGRILAQASPGPGERIVVAPVDVSALRHERATRRGHHMLAHLRSEAYPVYRSHVYPPEGRERPAVRRREQRAHRRGEGAARVVASRPVGSRMLRHSIVFLLALSLGAPVPAAPQSPPRSRGHRRPRSPGPSSAASRARPSHERRRGQLVPLRGRAGHAQRAPRAGRRDVGRGLDRDRYARPAGAPCPTLRKRYSIAEFVLEGPALSFMDSGGNEWTLSLRRERRDPAGAAGMAAGRRRGAARRGLLAPRRAAPARAVERRGPAAPPGHGRGRERPRPRSRPVERGEAGRPHRRHHWARTSSALGLLYGANKLGKGSSETGVVTCSPRTCIVGAPNEPCFCEGNVLSGASCGTTRAGRPHRCALRRQGRAVPVRPVVQQRPLRGSRRPVPVLKPPAAVARMLGAGPGWLTADRSHRRGRGQPRRPLGHPCRAAGGARRGAPRLRARRRRPARRGSSAASRRCGPTSRSSRPRPRSRASATRASVRPSLTRQAAESALLIFLRSHAEVVRIRIASTGGRPLVHVGRRGGVPVLWVSASPTGEEGAAIDPRRPRLIAKLPQAKRSAHSPEA